MLKFVSPPRPFAGVFQSPGSVFSCYVFLICKTKIFLYFLNELSPLPLNSGPTKSRSTPVVFVVEMWADSSSHKRTTLKTEGQVQVENAQSRVGQEVETEWIQQK